ncbi:MAG: hypothetical protein AAFX76_10385 [Planctomycetota bacterium]
MPVVRGEATTGRTDVFSQYFGCQFGLYSSRMVRDRRWKYVWNPTSIDELYDLQADPPEFVNRIDDPEAQAPLDRLRHRMSVWCESIDDRLLNEFTRWELAPRRRQAHTSHPAHPQRSAATWKVEPEVAFIPNQGVTSLAK